MEYVTLLVVMAVLIALPPTRWGLSQAYENIISPLLFKQVPLFLNWLVQAHLIVLKNLAPRVFVVKTLSAKRLSVNKK